jgi:hypothetical protein
MVSRQSFTRGELDLPGHFLDFSFFDSVSASIPGTRSQRLETIVSKGMAERSGPAHAALAARPQRQGAPRLFKSVRNGTVSESIVDLALQASSKG